MSNFYQVLNLKFDVLESPKLNYSAMNRLVTYCSCFLAWSVGKKYDNIVTYQKFLATEIA